MCTFHGCEYREDPDSPYDPVCTYPEGPRPIPLSRTGPRTEK